MKYQKGFIVPLLLIIIAILFVGGGTYLYAQNNQEKLTVTRDVVVPQATSTVQTETTSSLIYKGGDSEYRKANGGILFNGVKIVDADAKTFQVVGLVEFEKNQIEEKARQENQTINYSKDDIHAFYNGVLISGADAKTFDFIYTGAFYQEYAKDKNHVYYKGDIIVGADSRTFKSLARHTYVFPGTGPYGVDGQHAFYGTEMIQGADVQTFDAWSTDTPGYAKDKNRVYFEGKVVPGANPKTFNFPRWDGA